MKIKRLLPAVVAGALTAAVFSGCGENGRVDKENHSSGSSGLGSDVSNAVSDTVSDTGEGLGDIADDIGDGMSDLGEDVSDGIGDLTGGDHTENSTKDDAGDAERDDTEKDETDPPLRDGSVSAISPVETQKKTNRV